MNRSKPKYDVAKLQELRDCAPFVKIVVKTYKRHMAPEQWKKLNMLVEILESNMTPTQFFTRFPDNKVNKIEAVIGKLKAKFGTLLNPDEVIVINDAEQPSTSATAGKNAAVSKEKTKEGPTTSTSISAEKRKINANAFKTTAVNGTAKKALGNTGEKVLQKTAAKTAGKPVNKPVQKPVDKPVAKRVEKPVTNKPAEKTVENGKLDDSKTVPKAFPTAEKQSTDVVSKPAPATKATNNIDEMDKSTGILGTIPLNLPKTVRPTTSKTLSKLPSGVDFERRANSPPPTKLSGLSLDLTSPSPPPLSTTTTTAAANAIGTRRHDYVRMHNSQTISPVTSPNTSTDSIVFSRRSKVVVPPSNGVEFERRCNPSPPPTTSSPSNIVDGLPDEVRLKSPSLLEARKKLAALSSTTATTTGDCTGGSTTPITILASPLASNSNDPRGRNSSYINSSISPPKPAAKSPQVAQVTPVVVPATPTQAVVPPVSSNSWSRNDNEFFKRTQPNNIPTKVCSTSVTAPSIGNNNNKHNANLNLNKVHAPAALPELLNVVETPINVFDRNVAFYAKNKEATQIPPRRFNSMPNGVELRDPRWSKSNGPGNTASPTSQQQTRNFVAQGLGQGRGRCGPGPYNNKGFEEVPHAPSWQTANKNYGYNMGNNKNVNGNNNHQMVWNNNKNINNNNNNNNNNGINTNHFNKNNTSFNYRPGFNNRPANHTHGCNNVPTNCNNNNIGHHGQFGNVPPVAKKTVPRTYREHLLAKQEKQRQLEAEEKKRKEAEKQRKLEAAEKQNQLEANETAVVASIENDKVQLDTSYRNVVLAGPNKKIDFKIPKKAAVEKKEDKIENVASDNKNSKAVALETELIVQKADSRMDKSDVVVDDRIIGEEQSSASGSVNNLSKVLKVGKVVVKVSKVKRIENMLKMDKANKVEKAEQLESTEKTEKSEKTENSEKKDKPEITEKTDKPETTEKTGKTDKTEKNESTSNTEKTELPENLNTMPKKNKSEKSDKEKKTETAVDKLDKHVSKKDKINTDIPKTNDDNENVENEPPTTVVDNTVITQQPAEKLPEVETTKDTQPPTSPRVSTDEAKHLKAKDANLEPEIEAKESPEPEPEPKPEPEKTEGEPEKETQKENVEECNQANVGNEEPQKMPKLPKIKVVLRPNAHAMVVIPIEVKESATKESEFSTETTSATVKLKRKTRRKSMMPVSSKPLVDKEELFAVGSLEYEDLVEHQRAQEKEASHTNAIESTSSANKESEFSTETTSATVNLKRKTRRKSMMPVSSKPLVDKEELFAVCSLDYEDLVEHQRAQEKEASHTNAIESTSTVSAPNNVNQRINKSLAVMFEKSDDNCSISTHNILAGKRRSRLNDLTLNETQLYKNVFKIANSSTSGGQKTTTKTKSTIANQIKKKVLTTTETADDSIGVSDTASARKRKRGRPPKDSPIKRQRVQSPENTFNDQKLKSDSSFKEDDLTNTITSSTEGLANDDKAAKSEAESLAKVGTTALAPPRPKKKTKRTELDKLNEDIAQMYYANDVMRATGRRTCTTTAKKQPSVDRESNSRSSSTHSKSRSRSSSFGLSTCNAELAPYIRNVARRGRPYAVGRGLDRYSFSRMITQSVRMQTKRCRVRVARCAQLQRMLNKKDDTESESEEHNWSCLVKNVNPEWHSMSSVLTSCVICAEGIKTSTLHYIQRHDENYGARLPPGVLQDLRAGINNRPIYRTDIRTYGYKCPFCMKHLQMRNGNWVEHFARHTGEFNFQCSNCKMPRSRYNEGEQHVLKCGNGAKLLSFQAYDCSMPVHVHVCHLCDFIQLNRSNLERHMQRHHGINHRSLSHLGQALILYRNDNVPVMKSPTAIKKLVRRHNASSKSKAAAMSAAVDNQNKKKKKNKTANAIPKVSNKLFKNTKMEPLEAIAVAAMPTEMEIDMEQEQVEVVSNGGSLGMPPLLPDEEQLLVINECKLELADDDEGQRPEVVQDQLSQVEMTTVTAEAEADPVSVADSIPKVELSMATETIIELQLAQIDETEKEAESREQIGQAEPTVLTEPVVEQTAEVQEIELLETEQTEAEPAEPNQAEPGQTEPDQTEPNQTESEQQEPQEEMDFESEQPMSETKPKQKTKSIFRNFQKFCSKLKSSGIPTTNSCNIGSKGNCNNVKQPNKSPHTPGGSDGEQVVPYLDTLLEANKKLTLPVTSNAQPAVAPTAAPTFYLISIHNVAYRLRSTPTVKPAYYCRYPGCSFIFSNELEGLENHFMRDHPLARWNGSCVECNLPALGISSELSINEELRHMVIKHMDQSVAPALAPLPTPPPTEVALPKLRVRRFTGDRLVPEPEPLTEVCSVQPQQAVEEESQTVLLPLINENTMLKDLLAARPRPPSQQQLELNAAGVGEFLCAKAAAPPVSILEAVPSMGVIINQHTDLGLAINQVYSLADASTPLVTAETVPLPAVRNDDFVLTQSLTQNYEGTIPAEINISIEPRSESPIGSSAADSAADALAVNEMDQQRTHHLIADRFRCMAANCNYCAHTVMCIREHMKFHSFSFGNQDYLRCAYCNHVGKDINDYVHHGVIEHGLANRSELQEPVESPSSALSQRIREVLNQRAVGATSTTVLSRTWYPSTAISNALDVTLTSQGENEMNIAMLFIELLKETGVDDNKLYACPMKGCSGSLTEDNFINHVRYHQNSNQSFGPLSCKYCRQAFDKPSMLRSHLQQMHGRHRYFCSICLETTVNPRLMLQHMHSLHEEAFQLVNCQQQFLELSSYHPDPQMPKCWVSAMEQPFGQKQMEEFLGRLVEELQMRRAGNKYVYRPSELSLLNRLSEYPNGLQCAECQFKTQVPRVLQQHLYAHKMQLVRLAYPAEDHAGDAMPQQQLASQELVSYMEGNSAQSESVSLTVTSPTSPVDPLLPMPAKIPVPSKQVVLVPKFNYVPKELRYICGVASCRVHLPTEQALRHHLATNHTYAEDFRCMHCNYMDITLMIEKILDHLSNHKRHIYQCGACSTFLPKRFNIDRHIYEKHVAHDVDVIIHRRSVNSSNPKKCGTRWINSVFSVRSQDNDWFCNFCQLVLDHESQMLAHLKFAHQRTHQYCCPYCECGSKEVVSLVYHIRQHHPGQRVQPMQCYLRVKSRNRQTLGFSCHNCPEATNSYQKISKHCEQEHGNRCQYKCSRCSFGHSLERNIMRHMIHEHPNMTGLAIQQFDRLPSELLDSELWKIAQPMINKQANTTAVPSRVITNSSNSLQTFEPIDLISSDEEELEIVDVVRTHVFNGVGTQKLYEFACSHCTEISSDIKELKANHWSKKHPEQPFYFCVQPQMCCPVCHGYRGNAKSLLEDHLPNVHQIRTLLACDLRVVKECAFCEYKYRGWNDLAQHMANESHLANDLKNLTDEELDGLLRLGSTKNEYYQCDMCRVIMPTKVAIAQHGNVEHNNAPFCFRLVPDDIIYHCSFCMYASTTELETLRHMLDHYKKFCLCHFCNVILSDGFDEYIQHCYTFHREEALRFQLVHTYEDLKKFLTQILYQFQNGLIISKSSLRNTRFSYEHLMKKLYEELVRKSQKPPIPRLLISQLINRNAMAAAAAAAPAALPDAPVPPLAAPARITNRRKTLNPNDLQAAMMQMPMQRKPKTNTIINWQTSFTGSRVAVAPDTATVAASGGGGGGVGAAAAAAAPPPPPPLPSPTAAAVPAAAAPIAQRANASSVRAILTSTPAPAATHNLISQLPILQRIQKRRSTYVEPGQLLAAYANAGGGDAKRHCGP